MSKKPARKSNRSVVLHRATAPIVAPPVTPVTVLPKPTVAPVKNVWPLQSQCMQFYGNPYQSGWYAANVTDVICPWPVHVGNIPVSHISIHKKCAASLVRVLNAVWEAVGKDASKIKQLHYDVYDGSYNLRPMRGGNAPSMHSFAVAIDWDAAENAFHSTRHRFTDNDLLIVKFKEEGWIWGGDWSPGSQDAMHVQAARVHA